MRRARLGAARRRSSRPRSTAWPTAGSTTSSAAASRATPPTRRWHVPHFEKMLYDNAQLARLYTRAWQVTARRPLPARRDARRSSTSCARCSTPRAGSSRRRTPTARASRGGSSCGRGTSSSTLVGPAVAAVLRRDARGQLGGDERAVASARRRPTSPRSTACRPTSSPPRWRTPGSCCSRSASDACAPAPTTRSSTAWNALAIGALAEAGRAFDEPAYVRGGGAVRRVRPDAPARRATAGCCARGATASPAARGSPTTTRCMAVGVPDAVRDHVRARAGSRRR